ncbi:MAG TPA: hypothetical protein VFI91_01870 [Longimicrobiaceae bacterium]|nr:hypothetical protein [Longimicrobiaceae bacterium]
MRQKRGKARLLTVTIAGAAIALLGACAGRQLAPVGEPVVDASATAADLIDATIPLNPRKATFSWNLREGTTRLHGRGVARYVAPERLRLDLFGPRGETYLAATLVGDRARIPDAVAEGIALPSPSLLWAALGVLRPPSGARLMSVTTTGPTTSIRYGVGEDEIYDFALETSPTGARLIRVERAGPSGVRETLELHYSEAGEITSTNYRDWSAYRDLVLEMEMVEDALPFPDEIWIPGGDR